MAEVPNRYATGTVNEGVLVITIMLEEIRDTSEAHACRDTMVALVDSTHATAVIIDLGCVTFLGSVGLVALLGVRRRMGGGRIILCNASAAVAEMLAVCRLIPKSESESGPFEYTRTLSSAHDKLAAVGSTG